MAFTTYLTFQHCFSNVNSAYFTAVVNDSLSKAVYQSSYIFFLFKCIFLTPLHHITFQICEVMHWIEFEYIPKI